MTRLNSLPITLQKSLNQRSCLKVIAGLNNFDPLSVLKVSKAAGIGGADFLDIACDPRLVKLAIEASDLPVCVSSVEPDLFLPSVEAGASIVEIGNFDSFYEKGRFFQADEVLELALETRHLLPDVPMSVTVPHTLPLDQQAELAIDLVNAGADLIQSEGGTTSMVHSAGVLGLIEKAAPTLSATYVISKHLKDNSCNVPLICASGLSEVTVPMAVASGASAVGIGSAVNRLDDQLSMIAVVKCLRKAFFAHPLSSSFVL